MQPNCYATATVSEAISDSISSSVAYFLKSNVIVVPLSTIL